MTNSADLASCESADIQRRILELIEGASSIAISGHTSPDGDALGSVLGLGLSLMKFFPTRTLRFCWQTMTRSAHLLALWKAPTVWCAGICVRCNPDLFTSVDVPVVERLNNLLRCFVAPSMWCASIIIRRARSLPSCLRRVDAAACAMIIDRFGARRICRT